MGKTLENVNMEMEYFTSGPGQMKGIQGQIWSYRVSQKSTEKVTKESFFHTVLCHALNCKVTIVTV